MWGWGATARSTRWPRRLPSASACRVGRGLWNGWPRDGIPRNPARRSPLCGGVDRRIDVRKPRRQCLRQRSGSGAGCAGGRGFAETAAPAGLGATRGRTLRGWRWSARRPLTPGAGAPRRASSARAFANGARTERGHRRQTPASTTRAARRGVKSRATWASARHAGGLLGASPNLVCDARWRRIRRGTGPCSATWTANRTWRARVDVRCRPVR